VALGHCMRKLLHLVFAVWKTGQSFDCQHYPWLQENDIPSTDSPAATTPDTERPTCAPPLSEAPTTSPAPKAGNDKAVGHKGDRAPEKASGHHGCLQRKARRRPCQSTSGIRRRATQGGFRLLASTHHHGTSTRTSWHLGLIQGNSTATARSLPSARRSPGHPARQTIHVFRTAEQKHLSVFPRRLRRPRQCPGPMGRRPPLASLRSHPAFGSNLPSAQEQRRTRNGCTASHGQNEYQQYRYHAKRALTSIGTSLGVPRF